MPRQRPANKQEAVYQAFRERILDGSYSPGYRLVIDQLAREFGVSALPVREAIRRLEAEGYVVYQAGSGARVAPADAHSFMEGMTVLAILEAYATAAAATSLDAEDLARLRELNEEMRECMDTLDALRFSSLNRDFHALIVARCPVAYLMDMVNEATRRLDGIRRTVFTHIPVRARESIEEHASLIALIEDGAPFEQVEALARVHRMKTVDAFRSWHTDDLSPAGDRARAARPAPAPPSAEIVVDAGGRR
jgi:DNA-binding GntR family transcriptional regulator